MAADTEAAAGIVAAADTEAAAGTEQAAADTEQAAAGTEQAADTEQAAEHTVAAEHTAAVAALYNFFLCLCLFIRLTISALLRGYATCEYNDSKKCCDINDYLLHILYLVSFTNSLNI